MRFENGPDWPEGIAHRPATFAMFLARHDPRLFVDYVRWVASGRRGARTQEPAAPDVTPLNPAAARQFLTDQIGAWTDGPAVQGVRIEVPRAVAAATRLRSMAGDSSLGELAYALVRGLRPTAVVETGVAQGITSAYILAGLSDNGLGELHSIDLPPREMIDGGLVGLAVPRELRSRWTYHWGPSRRLLPPLLATLGASLMLFVHDSDHRYANMRWELERAWQSLGAGGWLVADDVELHSAFHDVAAGVAGVPSYVSQDAKPGWTGLMRKPSAAKP